MGLTKEEIGVVMDVALKCVVRTKNKTWHPKPNNIFSFGNKKLPKHTAVFSLLPVVSCPFATDECKKFCYDINTVNRFGPTRVSRKFKTEMAFYHLPILKKMIAGSIQEFKKVKKVRIHEGGDFFNQKYFNMWSELAGEYQNTLFYAYTRNYTIDTSRPDNFVLLLSDDTGKLKDYYSKFDGVSTVFSMDQAIPEDYFKCKMDCRICEACMKQGSFNKIAIPVHGQTRNQYKGAFNVK